jgi:fumarate reductase subunit D
MRAAYFQPYVDISDALVEMASLLSLFLVLLVGLLFQTGVASDGDDAEIKGRYMTPVIIFALVLPIVVGLYAVYHRVHGVMASARDIKARRAKGRVRRGTGTTSAEKRSAHAAAADELKKEDVFDADEEPSGVELLLADPALGGLAAGGLRADPVAPIPGGPGFHWGQSARDGGAC